LTILIVMGSMGVMKTTIDIQDELLARAKRHARKTGRPLRALVEEGLQQVLLTASSHRRYRLPDLSVGNASDRDPIEAYSWQDLREMIYAAPDT
jgi:Arc/MetJ family transcription regulator